MVDNTFGSVRVPQSGQALLIVVRGRTHCCYHDSLTVSTEVVLLRGRGHDVITIVAIFSNMFLFIDLWGYLQKPCQDGITVWNEGRLAPLASRLANRIIKKLSLSVSVHSFYVEPTMSARAEMTRPRVVRDLLMLEPSFSRSPSAPVFPARSLPARSTRLILATFSVPSYTHICIQ